MILKLTKNDIGITLRKYLKMPKSNGLINSITNTHNALMLPK